MVLYLWIVTRGKCRGIPTPPAADIDIEFLNVLLGTLRIIVPPPMLGVLLMATLDVESGIRNTCYLGGRTYLQRLSPRRAGPTSNVLSLLFPTSPTTGMRPSCGPAGNTVNITPQRPGLDKIRAISEEAHHLWYNGPVDRELERSSDAGARDNMVQYRVGRA